MTKVEYERQMVEIRKRNQQIIYKRNLDTERRRFTKKKKMETNKVIAIYLFVLLNAIVIYAMVSMWQFADLSYLGVLITDIGAQIILYGIYCAKAYNAKKSEEEMKLKRDEMLLNSKCGGSDTNFVG